MIKKSIKTHTRLLTCLVALAVVFATFLAGTFTTQAGTDVFGDIELKVGDTLGFVYYTSQPYTETTRMRFTINGRTSESMAYPNDGKCVFIFNDIYPHELAKEVTATILVDGKETVSSTGLSIKSFLLQMLMDPTSSAEERQFASDTLQYGEQTRLYRNANVDVADRDYVSITDDINTSIYKHYKPQDIDSNFVGSAMGLGVSASNIRLSSIGIAYHNTNRYVVTLQVPQNSNVNLSKIKVKIGDKEFTSTAFVNKGNGQYEIQSDPINAYDILDEAIPRTTQFTLLVNNKVVQQSSYNILDYIYQLQDTTQGGSLALKYARSLYRYGQSAEAAYKGNRIVAIALNKGPGDANGQMVPGSKDAQTPTGGEITAYYSDGTSTVIKEGIVWNNTDIHGNEIKITDDTHTKKFTVEGSYYDDTSGKTYTVTGTIELHNDMISVERYTDPNIYRPTSYAANYTPTGTKLRCKWSNGHTAIRSATHNSIAMEPYKCHEYGFFPTTASYTDPKSNITLSTKTFLLYENPITSITIEDTTADFNDGILDNTTTPKAPKYSVTYSNGLSINKLSTLTNTITSGDTTQTLKYTFNLAALVYNGYNITVTQNVTGTLSCPAHNTWERMENGNRTTYAGSDKTITGTCNVTATNGEKELKITTTPSVYGGTITSKNNLTGNPNSTVNGQLTGGTVTMTYYNGAIETITENGINYSTSDTIKDTAYSKTVTVTATYKGKDGNTYTGTNNITIYNWMKSIKQNKNAVINAAKYTNNTVQVPGSALNNTIEVTYYNTVTDVRGDASSIAVSLNNNTRTEFYVANVTNTTIGDAVRTNASAASSGTPAYQIVVTYTDARSGASYDASKRTQTITGYKIAVRNDVTGFVANQSKTCTMTSTSGSTITPTGTVQVNLTNGQKVGVTPKSYAAVNTITTAKETEKSTSNITYTSSLGTTITGSVSVTVANPIISTVLYTDPANITLTAKTAITESQLKDCVLTATYTNGTTGYINANTYANLTNVLINDHTRSRQFTIKAGYSSAYSKPSQVDAKVILLNPPKNASFVLSTFTNSNKGILTSSGVTPSGTITVTFNNTATQTYTGTIQTIYKSGTTNSSSAATKNESGSCSVTATVKVPAGNSYQRFYQGANATATTQPEQTYTPSATAYWLNNPSSIAIASASCSVATYTQSKVTPTASVTVTYTNGATNTKTATCTQVNNITDDTTSATRTFTASYTANSDTANSVTKTCSGSVTLNNPVTSYSVSNKDEYFPGETQKTWTISGKATYTNGYSPTKNATALTINSTSGDTDVITFAKVGTNQLKATYSGTSTKSSTATCSATFGGKSSSFTAKIKNHPDTLTAYLDSSRSDQAPTSKSDGSSSSDFPEMRYFSGSTFNATKRLYFKLEYSNGKKSDVAWNSSNIEYTTAPNHNGIYAYGTTEANSTKNWSTSCITKYVARYKLGDIKPTCTFYATPRAYEKEFYTRGSCYGASSGHNGYVGGSYINLDIRIKQETVLSNGKPRTDSSTEYAGTDGNSTWWLGKASGSGTSWSTAKGATYTKYTSVQSSSVLTGNNWIECSGTAGGYTLYVIFSTGNTSYRYVNSTSNRENSNWSSSSINLTHTTGTAPT